MERNCTCGNDRCPRSPLYNVCEHCMCLSVPQIPQGQTFISYGGPTGSQCCKCQHFVPSVSHWGQRLISSATLRSGG